MVGILINKEGELMQISRRAFFTLFALLFLNMALLLFFLKESTNVKDFYISIAAGTTGMACLLWLLSYKTSSAWKISMIVHGMLLSLQKQSSNYFIERRRSMRFKSQLLLIVFYIVLFIDGQNTVCAKEKLYIPNDIFNLPSNLRCIRSSEKADILPPLGLEYPLILKRGTVVPLGTWEENPEDPKYLKLREPLKRLDIKTGDEKLCTVYRLYVTQDIYDDTGCYVVLPQYTEIHLLCHGRKELDNVY